MLGIFRWSTPRPCQGYCSLELRQALRPSSPGGLPAPCILMRRAQACPQTVSNQGTKTKLIRTSQCAWPLEGFSEHLQSLAHFELCRPRFGVLVPCQHPRSTPEKERSKLETAVAKVGRLALGGVKENFIFHPYSTRTEGVVGPKKLKAWLRRGPNDFENTIWQE